LSAGCPACLEHRGHWHHDARRDDARQPGPCRLPADRPCRHPRHLPAGRSGCPAATVPATTARLGGIAGRRCHRLVCGVYPVHRLLRFHAAAQQRERCGMKDEQSAPVPTGALLLAVVALIWIGMILGISGLATPIKFQAASLTLPVALDVGQTTFAAFNKMEWLLAAVLAIAVLPCRPALLSLRLLLTVAAV